MTGQSKSKLASALGAPASAYVSAHIFQLEFKLFEGPRVSFSCDFGKGRTGVVQSPTGGSSCPEAEIVRILRSAHWGAVWVEDWPPSTVPVDWRWALMTDDNPPPEIRQRHEGIRELVRSRTGQKRAGCWDVLAWKDHALWYIEAKGRGDGLSKNQVTWWVAATELDPSIEFALVEWRPRIEPPM